MLKVTIMNALIPIGAHGTLFPRYNRLKKPSKPKRRSKCTYAAGNSEYHHPFRVGNAEIIERDLRAAVERYNTLQSELEVSSQLLEKLKLTMQMRVALMRHWRESVSTRITGQFHTLMSQRGVKGSMKVDHKAGQLTLMVMCVHMYNFH